MARGGTRGTGAIALAISLSACVSPGEMLPGTISSASRGVLEFQIEKAARSGKVAARDPRSGERLTGTYVAIVRGANASSGGFASVGSAFINSGSSGTVTSRTANASAVLQGDRGTVLTCEMEIEAAISPHGIGNCFDGRGTNYRLQF